MDISKKSPQAIAEELGERFKTARLNANLSQAALAKEAGVSVKAIKNNEAGKSTLKSAISILAALGMTDQLNFFLPQQSVSPIQLLKLQGKERKRATGGDPEFKTSKGESSW